MNRTLRAAIVAALICFAAIAGLGLFLGFPTNGSLLSGLLAAVIGAGVLLAAARRAETFHTPDVDTEPQRDADGRLLGPDGKPQWRRPNDGHDRRDQQPGRPGSDHNDPST